MKKSSTKTSAKPATVKKPVAKKSAVKKPVAKKSTKKPTALIFGYKGHLGADIDMKGKFINNPTAPGQLGCVVDTKNIHINKSAKEMIKNAKREGGSFAPLMLTKHGNNKGSSIAIMGYGKVHMGKDIFIGRDCTLSILDDCTLMEDSEIPKDFKEFIDRSTL